MNSVISTLLSLHGPAVYAAITVLVFLEAAAFVGLVIPSETAVVVGGGSWRRVATSPFRSWRGWSPSPP